MSSHLVTFDGNMSLNDTRDACVIEQNAGLQLQTIEFSTIIDDGTVFLVNKAAFKLKVFDRLKNLLFIAIKDNDNPQTIKETNEAAGWTLICTSQIYVRNAVTKVMVFGKEDF